MWNLFERKKMNDPIIQRVENKLDEIYNILISKIPEYKRIPLYFAGGCIASLINKETPRDYDVFFVDDPALNYSKIVKPLTDRYADATPFGYNIYGMDEHLRDVQFNIITNGYCGTPNTIVNHFDFVHCQSYYIDGKLHINNETMNAIKYKEIVPTISWGNRDMLWSLRRAKKFIDRGYTLDQQWFQFMMHKVATSVSPYHFFAILDEFSAES